MGDLVSMAHLLQRSAFRSSSLVFKITRPASAVSFSMRSPASTQCGFAQETATNSRFDSPVLGESASSVWSMKTRPSDRSAISRTLLGQSLVFDCDDDDGG